MSLFLWLTGAAMSLLLLAFLLGLARLVRGPTLADRVAALELMMAVVIAVAATHAVVTDQVSLLDVAIAVSLISFLGTVAFAYYIERSG